MPDLNRTVQWQANNDIASLNVQLASRLGAGWGELGRRRTHKAPTC